MFQGFATVALTTMGAVAIVYILLNNRTGTAKLGTSATSAFTVIANADAGR